MDDLAERLAPTCSLRLSHPEAAAVTDKVQIAGAECAWKGFPGLFPCPFRLRPHGLEQDIDILLPGVPIRLDGEEDKPMHSKARSHSSTFGLSWSPANATLAILLTLLFLIFLLLFITLTAQPAQGQSYQVIYTFTANPGSGAGPAFPWGSVTMDRRGNIYGATEGNGTIGQEGSVYKLSQGYRGWVLTALHIFYDGDPDGSGPGAITVAQNGSVYGVTYGGGLDFPPGNGTFFNMRPQPHAPQNALNAWLDSVLYEFPGGTGPSGPASAIIFDARGNVYGTTPGGGVYGSGTVYELTPNAGGWTGSVLYNFAGGDDGNGPWSGVISDSAGNLYGTTLSGGNPGCQWSGCGMVFELTPSASGWSETVLYRFQGGSDGGNPSGGLIFDQQGNLYGLTGDGGSSGAGTAFELSPSAGVWTLNVLYNFAAGYSPVASLITDTAGNRYGVNNGGLYGNGSIFKLTPSSSGWIYTSLYDFPVSGSYGSGPNGPLYMDAQGNLYGTTQAGGDYQVCESGCGVVFELTP